VGTDDDTGLQAVNIAGDVGIAEEREERSPAHVRIDG
jgi:hypothetical protein